MRYLCIYTVFFVYTTGKLTMNIENHLSCGFFSLLVINRYVGSINCLSLKN